MDEVTEQLKQERLDSQAGYRNDLWISELKIQELAMSRVYVFISVPIPILQLTSCMELGWLFLISDSFLFSTMV